MTLLAEVRPPRARPTGRSGRPAGAGPLRARRCLLGVLLVAVPAWALARALPASGDVVNRGGLALLDDVAASALRPALDPDFLRVVADAALTTLALALLGTLAGLVVGLAGGLVLADVPWPGRVSWPVRAVRVLLRGAFVVVRAIHELVWALLFVSVLGIDPFVAVLALALPFGAQTAQVFGKAFDEADDRPLRALRAAGARPVAAVAFALLPATAPVLLSYSFYRFECALRSAVVLGVAGVGGLGFELTVSLQSRNWDEVWTLVGALLLLAAIVELWSDRVRADMAITSSAGWVTGAARGARARLRRSTTWSLGLVPLLAAVAWWWVGLSPGELLAPRAREAGVRLLGDMWPAALPGDSWGVLVGACLDSLAMAVLAMVAAVGTTLLVGPWATRPRADRRGRPRVLRRAGCLVARVLLLVLRTLPPTVWALVALLVLFPGILPGALALGLSTGGILARLAAEAWETIDLRARDALRNAGAPPLAAAAATMVPPATGHLVAYTLYRFEVCVRDTAIVGVVGAAGLGRLLAERMGAFDFPAVTSLLLASVAVSGLVELLGHAQRRLRTA